MSLTMNHEFARLYGNEIVAFPVEWLHMLCGLACINRTVFIFDTRQSYGLRTHKVRIALNSSWFHARLSWLCNFRVIRAILSFTSFFCGYHIWWRTRQNPFCTSLLFGMPHAIFPMNFGSLIKLSDTQCEWTMKIIGAKVYKCDINFCVCQRKRISWKWRALTKHMCALTTIFKR